MVNGKAAPANQRFRIITFSETFSYNMIENQRVCYDSTRWAQKELVRFGYAVCGHTVSNMLYVMNLCILNKLRNEVLYVYFIEDYTFHYGCYHNG